LEAKYNEAQAEIQRLRALLAAAPDPSSEPTETTGLRRRNRALSDDGSTIAGTEIGTILEDAQVQPEGVPLQVVLIIALGVFITTYLFF
jgi:vesicle-associated membrane protein-associated protein A